jgi:RimJ/RimL family protein N-acetyltransferase
MVEIRLAKPCDYQCIVALIQQDEPQFTLSIFEKKYLLSDKNLKIIAVKQDKIVGFIGGLAQTLPNNDLMYWAIDAVVDIQHRKQGIATQLLKSLKDYGKQVIGIGVKNEHILKAEINAGFKVNTHLRTFTAFPSFFVKNYLVKIDNKTTLKHDFIPNYAHLPCFDVLLDTHTQTFVVLKKEPSCVRIMQCNHDAEYLAIIPQVAKFYHKKVRFLVNTRHYSVWKTSLKTFAVPARKPEILIYTHDFMQDLPVYFAHSDWFMEYLP